MSIGMFFHWAQGQSFSCWVPTFYSLSKKKNLSKEKKERWHSIGESLFCSDCRPCPWRIVWHPHHVWRNGKDCNPGNGTGNVSGDWGKLQQNQWVGSRLQQWPAPGGLAGGLGKGWGLTVKRGHRIAFLFLLKSLPKRVSEELNQYLTPDCMVVKCMVAIMPQINVESQMTLPSLLSLPHIPPQSASQFIALMESIWDGELAHLYWDWHDAGKVLKFYGHIKRTTNYRGIGDARVFGRHYAFADGSRVFVHVNGAGIELAGPKTGTRAQPKTKQ